MIFRPHTAGLVLACAAGSAAVAFQALAAEKPAADAAFFQASVVPALARKCLTCHQPGNAAGGFDLTTRAGMLKGGARGPALVAGKPEASLLFSRTVARNGRKPEMPQKGAPLTAAEADALRRWIAAGAVFPEGFVLRQASRVDRNWWAYRPLSKAGPPAVPGIPAAWSRNPIDRFVYAKLRAKGLTPNPPADPRTLIRRATYDLTGLPPTPEEVEAFARDCERSGFRVRGSGSEPDRQKRRTGSHRFGPEPRTLNPEPYERLIDRLLASPRYGEQWGRHWLDVVRFGESNGFERNVLINNAWPFRDYVIRSFNADKPFDRLVLEHLAGDVIGAGDPDGEVGTAFLVCGPYGNVGNQDAAAAAQIRANTIDEIVRATGEAFLGTTVGCARCHDHKFDPVLKEDYYGLYATFAGVYHGERIIGAPAGPQPAAGPAPKAPAWWVGRFQAAPGPFQVFLGGDPQRKGDPVVPASLSALGGVTRPYRLTPEAPESERRLALARWIVAPDNPLTPRVLVNRVWQYHFGAGIVDTPSDFGAMGGRPSHPELLDWLAVSLNDGAGLAAPAGAASPAPSLRETPWSLKRLHRLIMLSQAYQQAGTFRAGAARVDGDSRLLWRFPPRRLAAEEVRDSMLCLAGKLDLRMGGPGFRLYDYQEDNVATYLPLDRPGPETYRRAVYHQNARAARVDLLTDFDCPDPAFAAPRRPTTTTPLQALTLLNHAFTLDLARFLAERLEKERPGDARAQVRRAFFLAYARLPAPEEQEACARLVEQRGLRAFCRVLLNSNELLYLD